MLRVGLRTAATAAILVLAAALPARADGPAPAPSAPPAPGSVHWTVSGHAGFVSDGTGGPGTQPPEQAGFSAGTSPLSPLTPYDTFSSAPLVPGNAADATLLATPTYTGRGFTAGVTLGLQLVRGSITNASYWLEPQLPALDPHLGAQVLPYRVAFPGAPGADDGGGFVATITSATLATRDGGLRLRAGWFDLAQTDRFVFTQPALQSGVPALTVAPAESLGDGPPALDTWGASGVAYPLHGVNLVAHRGLASAELSDAALPSLPGTGARLTLASAVIDHGEGTRFSAEFVHVSTGGLPVATTVLFGVGTLVPSPQGPLPFTTVGGQRQSILGVRAAFHALRGVDAVAELGSSTYAADGVARPGSAQPGSYLHAGVTHALGRAALALDVYRNDPSYATAILPYGIPENVWSVAWSWPGQWLKSNYQLIDNSAVNVDRQGYRAKATLTSGAFDVRAAFANFGEIAPISLTNATQTGFVDGFFLPQQNDAATLGRQKQYGFWTTWHAPLADVTFDYTEDAMRRPAVAAHPEDLVSYDTPEYALSATRKLGPGTLAAAGFARYAMRGSFGQGGTNIDFVQTVAFAGAQLRESPHLTTLVTVRRSAFSGIPSQPPAGPPPNFTGTLLLLEQRFAF